MSFGSRKFAEHEELENRENTNKIKELPTTTKIPEITTEITENPIEEIGALNCAVCIDNGLT